MVDQPIKPATATTTTTTTAESSNHIKNSKYRITIKLQLKPTQKRRRVAIIGSGPGGLVSAKYALESNLQPTIFDRNSEPGGLWVPGTAIWDDMHTNVSRYQVMFSDYPWKDGSSIIPSARDVQNYLLSYIKHFKIDKTLNLNTNVEAIRQLPNKKWQVRTTLFN
jgi:dimethylaniline monooxygenase (N-oxide forming)